MLCSIIKLIECTLRQTATCFLAPPRSADTPASTPLGLSLLESCIKKLTATSSKQPVLNEQHHALNALYSEKTNLHILFRHLPTSVQSFVPYLHLPNPSSIVPESEVRKLVTNWIKDLVVSVKEGAYNVLKSRVGSGSRLSQVRLAVLDLIYKVEFDHHDTENHTPDVTGTSKGDPILKSPPWATITSQLLEARFSFWTNLLRPTFVQRSKDLIRDAFLLITSQPSNLYASKLEALGSRDRNVEGFIWDSSKEGDTVIKNWTPAIMEITEGFEKVIMEVKIDIRPLFVMPGIGEGKIEGDVFDLQRYVA